MFCRSYRRRRPTSRHDDWDPAKGNRVRGSSIIHSQRGDFGMRAAYHSDPVPMNGILRAKSLGDAGEILQSTEAATNIHKFLHLLALRRRGKETCSLLLQPIPVSPERILVLVKHTPVLEPPEGIVGWNWRNHRPAGGLQETDKTRIPADRVRFQHRATAPERRGDAEQRQEKESSSRHSWRTPPFGSAEAKFVPIPRHHTSA